MGREGGETSILQPMAMRLKMEQSKQIAGHTQVLAEIERVYLTLSIQDYKLMLAVTERILAALPKKEPETTPLGLDSTLSDLGSEEGSAVPSDSSEAEGKNEDEDEDEKKAKEKEKEKEKEEEEEEEEQGMD